MKDDFILTRSEAYLAGYKIERGDYTCTTDNRMDRWYVAEMDSDVVDHRGSGFRTKREDAGGDHRECAHGRLLPVAG